MNRMTTPEIIDEIKNLISFSIQERNVENNGFQTLHRSIVKKYFEAKQVVINYDNQTIDMQLPVGHRKYTSITFECQDIERFLKSCLKKDEKSLFYYQSLLSNYNVTSAA
ncbi:hypothetical protein MKO06_02155 [Gramella sp. GC03-9]|uniref:Uncharacterized protein n=1 Tax=Christiangramia oceanisediminis TaxID=2920386 RepID=A0A9X2I9W6_9FLAO|nr:hypothetical protein [Gramella oceanisediminis]MCP9198693.1 hypothetical protein [Gramella oceanisediminis]